MKKRAGEGVTGKRRRLLTPQRERELRAFVKLLVHSCAKYGYSIRASNASLDMEIYDARNEYPEDWPVAAFVYEINRKRAVSLNIARWYEPEEAEAVRGAK
jgi:hypothetical protein